MSAVVCMYCMWHVWSVAGQKAKWGVADNNGGCIISQHGSFAQHNTTRHKLIEVRLDCLSALLTRALFHQIVET